jgi:hypothetical protein
MTAMDKTRGLSKPNKMQELSRHHGHHASQAVTLHPPTEETVHVTPKNHNAGTQTHGRRELPIKGKYRVDKDANHDSVNIRSAFVTRCILSPKFAVVLVYLVLTSEHWQPFHSFAKRGIKAPTGSTEDDIIGKLPKSKPRQKNIFQP